MTRQTSASPIDLISSISLCTCRAYPTAHGTGLCDRYGHILDIEMTPSQNWAALQHATCTRCGWRSRQNWLAEDFGKPMVQNYIAGHRNRWTGECTPQTDADMANAVRHANP